jgi:phage shock protein C
MQHYRLTRSMLDRILGGVCGGIGNYLSISGWWVRLAALALALTWLPVAVFTYFLLWLVMPSQSFADLPPILRPGELRAPRYARPEAMLILGALAILIGILILTQSTHLLDGPKGDLLAPSLLFLDGLVLLYKQLRGRL